MILSIYVADLTARSHDRASLSALISNDSAVPRFWGIFQCVAAIFDVGAAKPISRQKDWKFIASFCSNIQNGELP
jgi:hypothetical protein